MYVCDRREHHICGIHHWIILWSSYRKLAWVGFEPTTTKFRSDALTDGAIRPWIQLALRANFVHLLQFHYLFSVGDHFGHCLRQSPLLFWLKFCRCNPMSVAESTFAYLFVKCKQWSKISNISTLRSFQRIATVKEEQPERHQDMLCNESVSCKSNNWCKKEIPTKAK